MNLYDEEQTCFQITKAHTLDSAISLLRMHPINKLARMQNDLCTRYPLCISKTLERLEMFFNRKLGFKIVPLKYVLVRKNLKDTTF